MQLCQRSLFRVFLITAIISTMLLLGQPRQLNAEHDPTDRSELNWFHPSAQRSKTGEFIYSLGVGLIGTPVMAFLLLGGTAGMVVVGTVCLSIAAINASDYPGGFADAIKDCPPFELKEQPPRLTEINQTDRPPDEERDEIKIRDD